jgi:3-methyl-2-oxobutanoate hydroxymethyltransferase
MTVKRFSTLDLQARKGNKPLVVLTAYTAPIAKLLDAQVDILLVGDSLGMVVYGLDSTLPVTLDMMIAHGQAVVRHSSRAMVVVDLPFGSYQASPAAGFEASARVMAQTGCTAVKLEGGREMAETISFITARGIPVVGHIGLMPQRVHALGGYRYQGRSEEEAAHILADAKAVQDAGACAIVLEGVREDIAREITAQLRIATIGIGASPACDGQVLVIDDMLGLTEKAPSFVKPYANLADLVTRAVKTYAEEVQNRTFPAPEHCFKGKK